MGVWVTILVHQFLMIVFRMRLLTKEALCAFSWGDSLDFPFELIHCNHTSTKLWRGYIFTAVCLCMCVCVCQPVCLSVCLSVCQWTKFQLNGCTDLDAVFARWLLTALAQTLLKLVTFGWRSWSQWRNIIFFISEKRQKVERKTSKGAWWNFGWSGGRAFRWNCSTKHTVYGKLERKRGRTKEREGR